MKPKLSKQNIFIAVVVLLGGVFFLIQRALNGDLPSEMEKIERVERLAATVVPVIEDLHVAYFMDEPDCANLAYPRGDFVEGDPAHGSGSTNNPIQFDAGARADLDRIKAMLEASGTPIERFGGRFSNDGRLLEAWFMSTHGAPLATSWSLEYDPAGRLSSKSRNAHAHTGRGSLCLVVLLLRRRARTRGSPLVWLDSEQVARCRQVRNHPKIRSAVGSVPGGPFVEMIHDQAGAFGSPYNHPVVRI